MRRLLVKRWLKALMFVVCLSPMAFLGWKALHNELSANPIEYITHFTGDWTLRFLAITLAITPLRKLAGLRPKAVWAGHEAGLRGDPGLVVETLCRYHRPIEFPDIVEAGLRVARLGTTSVRHEIGLFRRGDDAPAATGHFVHVFVDRATRRPVAIPDKMRAALEKLI